MTLVICYSRTSRPSARVLRDTLCDMGVDVTLNRGYEGDLNWGRNATNCELNTDIRGVTDKLAMRTAFMSAGVPMPCLASYRYPVVARTTHHRQRSGMWVCENLGALNAAYEAGATHHMEWLEGYKEFRVHMFMGRSIRMSEKDFTRPRSEKEIYTVIRPTLEHKRHLRDAARLAVEAVGLDFGAVDILGNEQEAYVLEVNAAPGIKGSTPRVYAQAIVRWMNGGNNADEED